MALIEETIRVSAAIAPPGETVRDFGRGLYLHSVDSVITDQGEAELIRAVRVYPTAAALEAASPGSEVVAAGRAWFGADPHPRNLLIGTQIAAAQPSLIYSAQPDTVAVIEALGNSVAFSLNSNNFTVNFDGLTTYAQIASALQTGIQTVGAYSAATVTYNAAGRFVIQGGVTYDFGAGFTASNATAALGVSGSGVSILENVEDVETLTAALNRIESVDASFFWVSVSPDVTQDYDDLLEVRNWVAARRLQVGAIFDLFGTAVLTPPDTSSFGARLSALGGDGIALIFNGTTAGAIDQKGIRYAARFSSVNFDQPASDINGKFLTLSGGTPTPLTSSQRAELDRKRINWYVPAGDGAATGEGTSLGTWLDVYYFLSWFASALRTAAWNHLRSSAGAGGTPLTDRGLAAISGALAAVCEQAVRFGAIAPNTVSLVTQQAIRQATGNEDFDGVLSTGYLIVPPRISDLSQTQRDTRSAIPIKIYAKGSGKINNLDISLTLEN